MANCEIILTSDIFEELSISALVDTQQSSDYRRPIMSMTSITNCKRWDSFKNDEHFYWDNEDWILDTLLPVLNEYINSNSEGRTNLDAILINDSEDKDDRDDRNKIRSHEMIVELHSLILIAISVGLFPNYWYKPRN